MKNKQEILEKQKVYYERNKTTFLEKQAKYRAINRDKIREKQNQKVNCECGCIMSKSNMLRHKESKFHLEFIKNNPPSI